MHVPLLYGEIRPVGDSDGAIDVDLNVSMKSFVNVVVCRPGSGLPQ